MKRHILPVAVAGAALVLPLSLTGPAQAAAAPSASSTPAAPAATAYPNAPATIPAATERAPLPGTKKYQRKIRVHTNKARKNHNRKKLRGNKCIDGFANRWARKMARRQQLTHQNLRPILRRCNLRMVGENIAYGYPSGKAVVRGWMKSPGHRANILRRGYRLLGVGVARDSRGRAWASQVFGRR